MKVRILALVVDALGGTGGISQYNRDLIRAWSESEAVEQIIVLSRFAAPSSRPAPAKVVERRPVNSASLYGMRAILQSMQGPKFDFVFCGHLHMMPVAMFVSKLTGTPVWLQLHGLEAWQARSGFFRWCVENAAVVTAVSRHTRRLFLRWANIDANNVLVLPNTVGDRFSSDEDRGRAKSTFGLSEKRVLLTVSRLAKSEGYKGHEQIINCLPELMGQFNELVYVIAGDGDLRGELEELVRRKGLEDFVIFTGPVERKALPTLYRAADVFVMPSRGEGFGIVYLEALACGIPVIAGNSDGARDPLHDGEFGTLISEKNLAAEIRRLLTDSVDTESADSRGRETWAAARRHFGNEVFVQLVNEITTRFQAQAAQ